MRLVDWGETNFVPKPDREPGERQKRRPRGLYGRVASIVLEESLAGLELEPVRLAGRMADLGSGAGFPGMVLAIALPNTHMSLLERAAHKCNFLRRAARELGLDNVDVVESSVQRWSEGIGTCDVVTSRKLGRLDTMVEWSEPLLRPGGAVALWPGPTDFSDDDVALAKAAGRRAGLRLVHMHPLYTGRYGTKGDVKHLHLYEKVTGRFERKQGKRRPKRPASTS